MGAPEGPKTTQEGPKNSLRLTKLGLRGLQEHLTTVQELQRRPKCSPKGPQQAGRAAHEVQERFKRPQEAPRGSREAPIEAPIGPERGL